MHILYLHQYFCPPGGSGNDRSREFAAQWVKAGHRVTMITCPAFFPHELKYPALQNPNKNYEFDCEGIRVISVPVDYSHHMDFWARIMAFAQFYQKAVKAGKKAAAVDVIYASSTPLQVGTAGMILSRYHKVPFVFEAVDVWPDVPIDMGFIRNPVLKWSLRRTAKKIYSTAAHIIALSEGMKKQILQSGVDANKVSVVHNGTNPEKFPFMEHPEAEITNVIYAGTVGVANGLSQLMDAAHLLQQKGRGDIRFTVLGTGNDYVKVRRHAEDLQLGNVEFLEQVPKEKVPEILKRAHIGVVCFANFPTLEANSANKFYDYLATGLPVVINYKGWQSEYLEKYNCGLSSRQGDVQQFALNIEQLADQPRLRGQMGVNARQLVVEKFDRKHLAQSALEILQRALHAG